MKLFAALSTIFCVGGGVWMLTTQPADPNSIFGPLLHGIGLLAIGIGCYVGPALIQKTRTVEALERFAPPTQTQLSSRSSS